MADTLFDEDDDDDLWIDDPYAEADDLAEHTMQSPVLVNYDPNIELEDGWTDWEYYSDDFWDEEGPDRKRRKLRKSNNGRGSSTVKLEQNSKRTEKIPKLSLGEPASSDDEKITRTRQPVVWRIKGNSPRPPIVQAGKEEKVSILKDWRERFKPSLVQRKSRETSSNGSQRAIAVVIEQQLDHDDDAPIFYEDGMEVELPNGLALPKSLEDVLRGGLASISDVDSSGSESEVEVSTPKLPNNTRKRKLSASTEQPPELIPAEALPLPKRPRWLDQGLSKTTNPALIAALKPTRSINHITNTEVPTRKRRPSASPEPQPERRMGNSLSGKKRARPSTRSGAISPNTKTGEDCVPSQPSKRGKRGPDSVRNPVVGVNGARDDGSATTHGVTAQESKSEQKGRKRKIHDTKENLGHDEPEAKRVKSHVTGNATAAKKNAEAVKKNNQLGTLEARAVKEPATKENARPKAPAVTQRRSTRLR
ncbi:MAG: hypothetical protein Q9218_003694 [Villophora microphyllina]